MTAPPFLVPLGPETLAGLGIPGGWPYGLADQVRFGEIDGLGHVNHLAYLRWFESLRVAYLRDYGVTNLDGQGPGVVVRQVQAAYHQPMFLGETYVATTRTTALGRTSFTMAFAVWTPPWGGALRPKLEGEAVMVYLGREGGPKAPIPDDVRDRLVARDGAAAR